MGVFSLRITQNVEYIVCNDGNSTSNSNPERQEALEI